MRIFTYNFPDNAHHICFKVLVPSDVLVGFCVQGRRGRYAADINNVRVRVTYSSIPFRRFPKTKRPTLNEVKADQMGVEKGAHTRTSGAAAGLRTCSALSYIQHTCSVPMCLVADLYLRLIN